MITQHDHAKLSGDIARHFREIFFVNELYIENVLLAIYEHDRAWIELDHTPVWNDKNASPFSFMDYPLIPKLAYYKQGINQVEEKNPYAALLCSLHYSSFRIFQNTTQANCLQFYNQELIRQRRIRSNFSQINQETISAHLRLLQLCDDISLYVCLNQAGVTKENEHPWYRAGFNNTAFEANWINEKEISLLPSPFRNALKVKLRLKRVLKRMINQLGIEEAYKNSDWIEQELIFLNHAKQTETFT